MAIYTEPPAAREAYPSAMTSAPAEMTLADVLRIVSQHRRLFLFLPLGLAISFGAWSMLQARTYTASAAFAAHGANAPVGVSGIAAQLGIGIPTSSGEGPAYYAEVAKSSAVLRPIADSSIKVGARAVPMPAVFGVEEADSARRRALTAEALRAAIDVQTARETGIVRVLVTAEDPETAAQIAGYILAQVNDFNMAQRQAQAARERQFAERQLMSARAEVNAAEGRLASFYVRNRQWQNSPALTVEHDRLRRAIDERQEVATTLTQTFDQARLEEVRNVPRISVLEPASAPLRGNPRGTPKKAAAGLLLGLILAAVIVFGREYLRANALLRERPGVVA
jgi:capsular polysaccharide biosynthesis protein